MFRPLAASLAALLLAGGVASAQNVPFDSLNEGTRGFNGPARNLVIRTELELRRSGVDRLIPAGTRVDFRSEMVVAVFMGSQRSSGYAIEVSAIERKMLPRPAIFPPPPAQYVLNIDVVERRPPPGSIQASVMTSPYHVVKLARSKDRVAFRVSQATSSLTGIRPTGGDARATALTTLVRENGMFLGFVRKGALLKVLQADDGSGRTLVQHGGATGYVKSSRIEAVQAEAAQADAGQADPAPAIGLAGSLPANE